MLILELHDLAAVLADEVHVVRVLDVVWVVKFVVLAEVHLFEHTAFDQQWQGAIDGGSRDARLNLARHVQQLLRRVVLRGAECRPDDRIPRHGLAETFRGEEFVNAFAEGGLHVWAGL